MAIRQITQFYALEEDRFGFFELTRLSDGARAFFQGDDAALWLRNMETIERLFAGDEDRLNESFDCLCSGYDEVLSA